ncbi:hypothetical protein ThimaDRAFT_1146 [Thiocapsa marina 5811]|uniref:Uncharacterized protein n=1 Tax=Thiocapsa marina 5811 TaxID=768671 RepID=F9U7S0_9GAMM|nr:hypothetical protein ThimaDRAFT_1146 [Thiocapsa marina 5811]
MGRLLPLGSPEPTKTSWTAGSRKSGGRSGRVSADGPEAFSWNTVTDNKARPARRLASGQSPAVFSLPMNPSR